MGIKEDFLKACENGDLQTVQDLLQHNHHPKKWYKGITKFAGKEIDLNIGSQDGSTPLMLATRNGHISIINALIPYLDTNQLNALNTHSLSALIIATRENNVNAMNALLSAPGILPNLLNRRGHNALIMAAHCGHLEALRVLLAVPGIYLNATQPGVKTPLMWAAESGHIEVIQELLTIQGIDIHYNLEGETAISMAFENGHPEVVALLERHGATLPAHLRAEANNHLNGAQSVHEVSVHVSVSRSAKNLALQYAFSPEQITVSVKEILFWLDNDFTNTDTLPKEYNPVWLAPARRCVERLSLLDFIDQRSGISMPQAIAFVWAGINNRYAKGQNTTPLEIEEIISRRINFLKTLYEIQREYNLSGGARPIDDGAADRPTCVSGSFNKLIAALNEVGHAGVEIIFVTKAYIGELIPYLTKKAFSCLPEEDKAKFAQGWESENNEEIQGNCFTLLKNWVKNKLHELFDAFKEELPDLDNIVEEAVSGVQDTDMDEVMAQQRTIGQDETKEPDMPKVSSTFSMTRNKSINFAFYQGSETKENVDSAEKALVSQTQKLTLNTIG